MKLTIERANLLKSLGYVRNVVEKRTTIPILANVALRAGEDGLHLKATDLEREIVESTRAEVDMAGATTVSAHTLFEIVRKLPDGAQIALQLDKEKERLAIVSGRSRFTLQTIAPEDFPDLSPGEFTHRFEIGAADLKRLIDKTEFAISDEATRYYLNGIYLHQAKRGALDTLRTVSTDGHRLAQAETPLPEGAGGMPGVILPRKTVHELQRMLGDSETAITVSLSSARVRFEIGSVTLTSKLIDGTFPDYQRVIPKGNDKTLKVDNADLIAALDRVSTIASERVAGVKLEIGDGKLVLSVKNPEGGSATEELAAEYGPVASGGPNADPMEIGFNAKYLIEIGGQIGSEMAECLIANPGSPIVVKDARDEGALYVLMPMRV